jgi:DNA-binding response OmpR family regulator
MSNDTGVHRGETTLDTRAYVSLPRFLVIDDYPGTRAACCACLGELGYEAVGMPSAIVTADAPARLYIDVVIITHKPPRCDGAALLRNLRMHAKGLLAIAVIDDIPDEVLAFEHGVVLLRPFSIDALAAAIERVRAFVR